MTLKPKYACGSLTSFGAGRFVCTAMTNSRARYRLLKTWVLCRVEPNLAAKRAAASTAMECQYPGSNACHRRFSASRSTSDKESHSPKFIRIPRSALDYDHNPPRIQRISVQNPMAAAPNWRTQTGLFTDLDGSG